MAVMVTFYSLAPKPPANGDNTFAGIASGKVSRGRKWFRLEAAPEDVYLFPDEAAPEDVGRWFAETHAGKAWVAYIMDGEARPLNNYAALNATPGGWSARKNAIASYEHGRAGWIVFTG